MILKYHHTDKGFCRVCFTTQGKVNPENEYYYCLQEEGMPLKCTGVQTPLKMHHGNQNTQ